MERDRVPKCLCTALPHIVRESKGAAEVRSQNFKATIGSATARKAKIMQEYRYSNQFGIRSKSTMLGQLGSVEPRARHVVEKPRLRYCFCLCIGIPNRPTVGQLQIQLPAERQRFAEIRLFVLAHVSLH